eukprot:TRINITY_DN2401_c0_g2_i1.p1 TRINITY_DN2401_c0_g2~~TRINITY_DN2401_c0_g2_i1.p1  ORF type:complete len:416 (-),score=97.34 TRINITY_DN2401_c0_g2_i1:168-1415(-)
MMVSTVGSSSVAAASASSVESVHQVTAGASSTVYHEPIATAVSVYEPQQGHTEGAMAAAVLAPPRWTPDAQAVNCRNCGRLFDWARRKHHCRCCGRIFCYACSKHQALLPRSFGTRDPQRVCDECKVTLEPLQADLINTFSNAVRANEVANGAKRGLSPYLNKPLSFTLGAEVRKAAYSVFNFMRAGVVQDSSIPTELLTCAKGLAFITVLKAGMVWVGNFGTGLVVARLDKPRQALRPSADAAGQACGRRRPRHPPPPQQQQCHLLSTEWSAPSAIGTIGMGWGACIGANITDVVLVLNTAAAVEAFCGAGQMSLGAGISVAAGPIGRAGAGGVTIGTDGDVAPVLSYSHSRGLFAGISLEGAVIAARPDVNRAFYGKDVTAKQLLSGEVDPPPAAAPLYEALAEVKLASMAAP